MNIVHNCLDKRVGTSVQGRVAIRWEAEHGDTRVLTYDDLFRQVNRLANALRGLGLGCGDVVGLYMPMVPEIAVALLAAIKIGGIILLLFSGYRPGAITSRLRDAGAKVMRHVIRAATLGQDPGDRSALANHEVVDSIRPMTA